jgi:Archease protein family (MTH1598/TM1083)
MSGVPTLSGQTSGWEHFPHGADIGIRGWGSALAAAFEQAALAATASAIAAQLFFEVCAYTWLYLRST